MKSLCVLDSWYNHSTERDRSIIDHIFKSSFYNWPILFQMAPEILFLAMFFSLVFDELLKK